MPSNNNFFAKKLRLIRYLFIDDLVQLARVLIGEIQLLLELKGMGTLFRNTEHNIPGQYVPLRYSEYL
jgi:hypothetical protein